METDQFSLVLFLFEGEYNKKLYFRLYLAHNLSVPLRGPLTIALYHRRILAKLSRQYLYVHNTFFDVKETFSSREHITTDHVCSGDDLSTPFVFFSVPL